MDSINDGPNGSLESSMDITSGAVSAAAAEIDGIVAESGVVLAGAEIGARTDFKVSSPSGSGSRHASGGNGDKMAVGIGGKGTVVRCTTGGGSSVGGGSTDASPRPNKNWGPGGRLEEV
jgi:hypothetical protein